MLRLLTTIFLVSAGIFLYSYFRELNPGTVAVRTSPSIQFELSPVTLVIFSMAVGAVLVALAVGMRQTAHVIGNWHSTRLLRLSAFTFSGSSISRPPVEITTPSSSAISFTMVLSIFRKASSPNS